MRDAAKAALAHRVRATKGDDGQQEKESTTYCQVLNYLLAIYDTDGVMAEVDEERTNFKQPEGMSIVHYSEML